MNRTVAARAAGFSLQELMVVLGIVMILLALSLPFMLESRKRGLETSGVAGLRAIYSAQQRFEQRESRYATLAELADGDVLDPSLGEGSKQGYRYAIETESEPDAQWAAFCWPAQWGVSGDEVFLVSQTGRIMYTSQKPFEGHDPSPWVSSHVFFSSYRLQHLDGWSYLDGGTIRSGDLADAGEGGEGDGGDGDGGGGGGGGGGGAGGGCAMALPGR